MTTELEISQELLADERQILQSDRERYLDCMNQKLLKDRHTPQEVRDGLILFHNVYAKVRPQSKKLSRAEVMRRLPVRTQFTGEFIGKNRQICRPGMVVCRRRVLKQTSYEMICLLLDGPKAGSHSHVTWREVQALEREGAIILVMTETDPPEEFLKITFP